MHTRARRPLRPLGFALNDHDAIARKNSAAASVHDDRRGGARLARVRTTFIRCLCWRADAVTVAQPFRQLDAAALS